MSPNLGNEEVPAMQKFRESILGGGCAKALPNRLCIFEVQKEARLEVVGLGVGVGGAEVEG